MGRDEAGRGPVRKMAFIGVTTGGSAIVPLFPRWVEALGLGPAALVGRDVPLRAPRDVHRRVLEDLLADPDVCGALVTAHKVDVLAAARDVFDELDPLARRCGEVSCVVRREGRVLGWARDPVTVGRALDDVLGAGPIPPVLCLGAGGAGCALAVHLAGRAARGPVTLVDRDEARLRAVRGVLAGLGDAAAGIEVVEGGDVAAHDALAEAMPPGSLVVNATGMGKDVPGSPLGDACRLPPGTVAWDWNYRGDLPFLAQARAQAGRGVRAVDGWDYFLHGWSDHMALVLGFHWTPDVFGRLRALAEAMRP